jgi:hypothetical protein
LRPHFLSVAGFIIQVKSDDPTEIIFEEGYSAFTHEDPTVKCDVNIIAHPGIPKELSEKKNLLFEAKNHDQDFFSIHRYDGAFKFIIYDQRNINIIQQIAILNADYSQWDVYIEPDDNGKIDPLRYPLGPLILYYLTVRFDAIMLHSSGIFDGMKGRIFSGFSGVGKSTMAGLWQQAGSLVINDDRLIIREKQGGFFMHNTPMYYVDIPKEKPLHSIYLISHSKENTIIKLSGATAVSRLMAYCIQHGYSSDILQHHLDFLTRLCAKVRVYDVGFKPDNQIVDLIKNHAD